VPLTAIDERKLETALNEPIFRQTQVIAIMKDKIFFAKNKAPKCPNNRRGRLIIRNLPFTVSVQNQPNYFCL